MNDSPIDRLLAAIDQLDVEAAVALVAPDGRVTTPDGRRAEGQEAVRQLLAGFLATLHSVTHRITAQWHQDNVWIAEVEATYELTDRLRIGALPRAFILRDGPQGFADLRVYGEHERPLADLDSVDVGMRLGGRWMPPL